LRRGEALGLSWDDVDFKAKTLRVNASLNDAGKRTRPKSNRSIRTLDLTDKALRILARQLEIQGLNETRLGNLWKGSEWNPVFSSDDGMPLNPRNFLRVVKRAAKAEGLDEHHLGPITIHSVRHYNQFRQLSIYMGTYWMTPEKGRSICYEIS
jgi:integrase